MGDGVAGRMTRHGLLLAGEQFIHGVGDAASTVAIGDAVHGFSGETNVEEIFFGHLSDEVVSRSFEMFTQKAAFALRRITGFFDEAV